MHVETECCGYVFLPHSERLPGQSVDEVNADIVKSGVLCGLDGLNCLLRRMPPADRLEQRVLQRLNTDTQAVDSCLAEVLEIVSSQVSRVGFECDFDGMAMVNGYRFDEPANSIDSEYAGCAAAKIDGSSRFVPPHSNLAQEGGYIRIATG